MTVDNEPRSVPPGVPANLITPQGNVPAIGVPNTQDYARLVFSAPYFETIAIAEVIQPSVTEAVENALPSLIPPYVDAAVLAGVQQYSVLLTGSTMSGPLFLSPLMPTQPSQAATMAYVDAMLATAGIPEVPPVPSGQIWGRETGQWVPISQAEGTFLPLSGGTMGGVINMSGNTITNMAAVPAMPNGAAPAQWVLNQIASVSLYQGTWDADTNTPDLTQLSTHVNAYTWIAITTSPSGVVIGAAIPGLQGQTVFNGDTIIYSTAQGAFSSIHAGGITLPEADGRYVQLAGSQMSGALLLNANATQNMQAVTFQQLEAAVANTVTPDAPADGQAYLRVGVGANRWVPGLPLAGGILTGTLTLAGNATTALMPVPLQQMTSAITAGTAGLLPIVGGTMTGPIVLAANAGTNLNPVPLQQLNSMLATYATQAFVTGAFLPLAGGTINPGALTIYNPATSGTTAGAIFNLVRPAGQNNTIFGYTGTAPSAAGQRWLIQLGSSTAESGGNAGSDFGISRFSDSGAVIDSVPIFQITRSSGLAAFGNNVQAVNYISTGTGILYSGDGGANNMGLTWNGGLGIVNFFVDGSFVGGLTPTGSDPRLKTNVTPVSIDCLGVINQVALHQFDMAGLGPDAVASHWDVGFLSDQIRPLIANSIAPGDGDKTYDMVNLLPIVACLIGAVQELSRLYQASANPPA